MKEVRIGLIGTGYIGRAHAIAYAQAPVVFNLRGRLVREMVAEVTPTLAAERAQALGFNRATGDWRALVADPNVDVVDICSPNNLHKEMALEAIHHGKHVYSEKPLALNAVDAREMVEAAQRAGVKTLIGFNYMKNPTAKLAKEIISRGEIGEVIHFYGTHNEDYMADPLAPIHWHCFTKTAGLGALGDLAAHIVNMAHYLVGDIEQVCGDLKIVVPDRPAHAGSSQRVAVENEDQAHAMVRFASGAQGVIEASRVACGRKMGLSYVITGTKGAIRFTQERMAELQLYLHEDPVSRQGFRTLLVGPAHPEYAAFCLGAGHGIGFNDQKTVEVRDLVDGIVAGTPMWPDFTEGWKVSRVLDAIARSHREGRWLNVTDIV
ncbi:Gfo/Idh/MocA family protein [Edwardsiella anguillarum]|uniref:Gfo/Idh/MocA family protein n=1 Tax=Edwardsiella anguillarum TaxID=1821960 RepID=UPI0024B6B580|nr:Gfo/Idh/MocA family oxidoreductase [Edwardsiella anguillarum]WHP82061.1 Gfo/Idh/MocA family oxidoreductase [Edwardsiella anguillarum]WHQ19594.1 Gfo/Idh/MocA family oxidoreductase [Edwardsiella anguillarum]WHQ23128.1 Gfo/Idh/MocA family oxidoreductase [Edwardsiella anguillarum]WHQ26657.1 Gfo/Idh/MocA family oxidoreductase [Edwardsiella anguillarum]WHQ30178.1 Gfo/Idh/MocA family oxidoreductase [Edwardsiella anguillarum]